MKLYIKQKFFSFTADYTVKDENGDDRYYIEGEFLTLGRQLTIYDAARNSVARVKQEVFHLLPTFVVYVGEQPIAKIVKAFTFFTPIYEIVDSNFVLEGDILGHEYDVVEGSQPRMHLSKEWFTWGDSYALDIYDVQYELICLAITMAVDACIDAAQSS